MSLKSSSCGASYIDSPAWIKKKTIAIYPINKKDDKCFQYAVTVALNHREILKGLQKYINVINFINKNK